MPPFLDSFKNDFPVFAPPVDPEPGKPYEYRETGNLSFELCADFSTSNMDNSNATIPRTPQPYYYPYSADNWNHTPGRVCFDRTIDPALYPKTPGALEAKPVYQ